LQKAARGMAWNCLGGKQPLNRCQQVRLLQYLMSGLPASFRVKETRFFGSTCVPILILEYRHFSGETVEVDISVGDSDEKTGMEKGYTDRLIRKALERTPRALPLVLLVKQWAKAQGVNKAYEGFINSLGWSLLCLFFLMGRGELPPETFQKSAEPCEANMAQREQLAAEGSAGAASLAYPPPLLRSHATDAKLSDEDVAGFFEAVAGFAPQRPASGGPTGISLCAGSEITGPASERAPFYIEDPGLMLATGQGENVARALTEATWRTILGRCKEAARALRGALGEHCAVGPETWARLLHGHSVPPETTGPSPQALGMWPKSTPAAASLGDTPRKRPWLEAALPGRPWKRQCTWAEERLDPATRGSTEAPPRPVTTLTPVP